MPFGIDGLIVVGSVVLLDGNPLGWLGVGPGVGISVFANVMSGLAFGWLAATWAGIPALSFALACFIFERWLKAQGKAGDAPTVTTASETASVPDAPSAPADAPVLGAPSALVPDAGYASGMGAASAPSANALKSVSGRTPRTHYRDVLAAGELPSVRAIQRDFKVGAPKARAIREDLAKYVRPRLATAA
jgi:hypothetical protein